MRPVLYQMTYNYFTHSVASLLVNTKWTPVINLYFWTFINDHPVFEGEILAKKNTKNGPITLFENSICIFFWGGEIKGKWEKLAVLDMFCHCSAIFEDILEMLYTYSSAIAIEHIDGFWKFWFYGIFFEKIKRDTIFEIFEIVKIQYSSFLALLILLLIIWDNWS